MSDKVSIYKNIKKKSPRDDVDDLIEYFQDQDRISGRPVGNISHYGYAASDSLYYENDPEGLAGKFGDDKVAIIQQDLQNFRKWQKERR